MPPPTSPTPPSSQSSPQSSPQSSTRPPRRLRLQDVAAQVGVSAKTVSNAYRDPTQLRPELRQQILTAAAELGYHGPDPLAAGLVRRAPGPIAVLYANPLAYAFDDPNTNEMLAGLATTAQAHGRGLLLLPGSTDAAQRGRTLDQAIIDAVVASSLDQDDPVLAAAIARRLPLVVLDQPRPAHLAALGAPHAPWVGIDDRAGAEQVAEHLFALGHRRIAVVSFALRPGQQPLLASVADQPGATLAVTRDRLAGYRAAAERHGIDWNSVPVTQGRDSTPQEGYRGAAAVLAMDPAPTALVCLSDRLAQGAIAAAGDLGLSVPRDVSVVGFDDAPVLAEHLGLTTIAQPSRLKGQAAAQALIAQLGGGSTSTVTRLPTQLVVRATTAPPRPPQ